MVVVFDEEKAREKTARFQKRKHNFDILFKVSSVVGIGAAICMGMACWLQWADSLLLPLFALAGFGIFVQHWAGMEVWSAPAPIVAYWMAIQGKKVLEVKATERSRGDGWAVCVVTEDADGVVGTSLIGVLDQKESTRVREVTVDLNDRVVYTPYGY